MSQKRLSSQSPKEVDTKEDKLTKIIDDATKEMEQEHSTTKDPEVPVQPTNANVTLQGEGSTSTSLSDISVQGENETHEVSLDPPFQGENPNS